MTELDIEAYAALSVALATAGDGRDALLAEHGLDEERWSAIEDGWYAALSKAEDEHGDADGVPPLVVQFAEVFQRAQQAQATGQDLMSFELYVSVTRSISRGRDVAQVLERQQISLATYLRAHQHWTMKMIGDPDLAMRFRHALR